MLRPYFSIITPTYNRAGELARAIASCRAQDLGDYEHIIVDDGSTDGSAELVRSSPDPRISYIQLSANGGQNPARNAGLSVARGLWMVMLDSDMELLPGALARLHGRCEAAGPKVGNVASTCRWDTGLVTPFPLESALSLDYTAYLEWLDRTEINEYFNCIRRDVFETAMYPEGRGGEAPFHLQLARRWRIEIEPDCAVIYHTSSRDRVTNPRRSSAISHLRLIAASMAAEAREILHEHGPNLRRWAPRTYAGWLNTAALFSYIRRERGKGLRYSLAAIQAEPRRLRTWATLALGMCSPRALILAKARHVARLNGQIAALSARHARTSGVVAGR